MEIRTFSNSARPGVGLPPRRESQRPLLPQHARHCPVLEAGSALGFLVYPPLEPFESFYIGFYGEGRYQFIYYFQTEKGEWTPIFTVKTALPVGGLGQSMQEVDIKQKDVRMSREDALLLMRKFVVPDDLGTPPGAVTLRGATNFQTPYGLGHGVHAGLQCHRAAGAAHVGCSCRDRLVHARNRVPLRAAARGGHLRAAHDADRPGVLRAARRDHTA